MNHRIIKGGGKMINFNTSKEEMRAISQIVKRASAKKDIIKDALALDMDITATHKNGNPLKLNDLLKADEFNFWHDVIGIMNHIDRTTGKLTNCFVPRFTQVA